MFGIVITVSVVALSVVVLTKYKDKHQEIPKYTEDNVTRDINIYKTAPRKNERGLELNLFKFHEDIKDLLYFADGALKNIDDKQFVKTVYGHGMKLSFTFSGMQEPSMIYTKAPVSIPTEEVEVPDYYPTYQSLEPEQKFIYLQFLKNPYNPNINIGYVFILYYGLERRLLTNDWEKSAEVIMKLRHVHLNKSFQSYSAEALILFSVLQKKPEIAIKTLQDMTDEEKQKFPCYLFLLCSYFFDIKIYAKTLMLYCDWFKFTNKNYIRKVPELFETELTKKIIEMTGSDYILLKPLLSEDELNQLEPHPLQIFANTSLRDTKVTVPFITESHVVTNTFNKLLAESHDNVKKLLAEQRKSCKQI